MGLYLWTIGRLVGSKETGDHDKSDTRARVRPQHPGATERDPAQWTGPDRQGEVPGYRRRWVNRSGQWFLATAAAGGKASGPLLFVQLFVANGNIVLPIVDNVRKITQCQVAKNVKRCFSID